MPVALFATSLDAHLERVKERLAAVADAGTFILGPEVAAFESEYAQYLGVHHVIGVANGTDAITVALRALGIKPGEEVIVPSFTFYATAEATVNAGAVPVFADIDPQTFNVTRETVEAVMTRKTRAIIAVHLFGNLAPVPLLREFGVPVLEDAAQAAGAKLDGRHAGALGDAATFSFFPSKNLFCLGDGGAIATNDPEVAETARRLRFHGSEDKTTHIENGYNSRLDEMQAAVLRTLLPHLDGWNQARRTVACSYGNSGMNDVLNLPAASDGAEHVYHLYVARHANPEWLSTTLSESGVASRGYYRTPVHRQPAMRRYAQRTGDLPGTDEAASTNIALPMGPALGHEQIEEVARSVMRACQ